MYVEVETAALNDSIEPLITVLRGRWFQHLVWCTDTYMWRNASLASNIHRLNIWKILITPSSKGMSGKSFQWLRFRPCWCTITPFSPLLFIYFLLVKLFWIAGPDCRVVRVTCWKARGRRVNTPPRQIFSFINFFQLSYHGIQFGEACTNEIKHGIHPE